MSIVLACPTIQRPLVCLLAALWGFPSAHAYQDVAAKMTAAWKMDLEGLERSLRNASQASSVGTERRTGSACLGAQHGPQLLFALIAGIMRLTVPGTRVPPMILWFLIRVFRGMDLLLLLFHEGLLEVGTTWDPDGLPAAYPFGHHYLTKGQETRNAL